jgi:hypothetical protein
MITISDVMEYIEQLAIDNPSLMDAPFEDFEIDINDKKYTIRLENNEIRS